MSCQNLLAYCLSLWPSLLNKPNVPFSIDRYSYYALLAGIEHTDVLLSISVTKFSSSSSSYAVPSVQVLLVKYG